MGIDTINNFSHNFILFLIKAFSFKDRKKRRGKKKTDMKKKIQEKIFLYIYLNATTTK